MTFHRPDAGRVGPTDTRPRVARHRAGPPSWLFVGLAVLAAVLLFLILDGQRRERLAPATSAPGADRQIAIAPLPPLVLPPEIPPPPPRPDAQVEIARPVAAMATPSPATPQFQPPVFSPPPVYAPPPTFTPPVAPAPSAPANTSPTAGSVLVIDTAARPRQPDAGPSRAGGAAEPGETRDAAVRSSSVRRPATTLAQGALIPAILETALDSSRPGLVRAVVSRDVASFDGSRVLIPRGSHLTGEYEADLSAGQARAMIRWTRLVRPDGETVALDSPAADLQGRAGVGGRVDSRFLQRFSLALLQTTLNLGASLAAREIGGDRGGVIIALPGSNATTGSAAAPSAPQSILRVAAGARIAVFVARDLEFTSGAPRR